MTHDDIIRLATEAAVLAEREACAKLVEEIADRHLEKTYASYWALRDAAFEIRARGLNAP